MWCSRLKIWHCPCCGSGHCHGVACDLHLGTSICGGHGPNKQTKTKTKGTITKSKIEKILPDLPPKSNSFKRQVVMNHVGTDDDMIIKTILLQPPPKKTKQNKKKRRGGDLGNVTSLFSLIPDVT